MSPSVRTSLTLLLPGRDRLAGQRVPPDLGRWLARGDRSEFKGSALEQLFDVLPRGWPVAAVTRERDAGDAAGACWLRADPAHVRAEINGARLLAHGRALGLTREQADALLVPLRPLFGDAGYALDAPHPHRWYVRLPSGSKLPRFTSPDEALGADFFDHLPADATPASAEGRRWRALLSECQVVLHNHPMNAQRAAQGLPSVNSVWFWGTGAKPDRVASAVDALATDDEVAHAFAAAASVRCEALPERWTAVPEPAKSAFDLRHVRGIEALHERWLAPIGQALEARRVDGVRLLFDDGVEYRLSAAQRWRIWRGPVVELAAADTPRDE
ncbi:phosphoglycerate mutase [Lysobacter korlensis]|uniref:Phosphoglycerate mutase n=1 Tax=Lysobacter korlensis TaxID=553636 RepID=A0ABV6RLN4_9GAMM